MSTRSTSGTTPAVIGLEQRFQNVRAFMIDRNVANYLSVFAACDVRFTEEEADRIRLWWNGRARVREEEASMLARMEDVVEHLKAA